MATLSRRYSPRKPTSPVELDRTSVTMIAYGQNKRLVFSVLTSRSCPCRPSTVPIVISGNSSWRRDDRRATCAWYGATIPTSSGGTPRATWGK